MTTNAGLIYKKMAEVMKDIGAIGKNKTNSAQGFKFRGIDDFVNNLYPALTRAGVFMAPKVTRAERELKEVERSSGKKGVDKHVHLEVSYTFYAEDGSNVVIGPIASEGIDSGDKATNKALSAALKYALIQTFSIPTEDMVDADLDSPTIALTPSRAVTATVLPPGRNDVTSATPAQVTPTADPAAGNAPAPAKRPSSFRRPGAAPAALAASAPAAAPAKAQSNDVNADEMDL